MTLKHLRFFVFVFAFAARAIGIPDLPAPQGIPSSFVDSTLIDSAALHSVASNKHRPSMLVDAQQGRPIEVEVILGEVVREARKRGVAVPVSLCSPDVGSNAKILITECINFGSALRCFTRC